MFVTFYICDNFHRFIYLIHHQQQVQYSSYARVVYIILIIACAEYCVSFKRCISIHRGKKYFHIETLFECIQAVNPEAWFLEKTEKIFSLDCDQLLLQFILSEL